MLLLRNYFRHRHLTILLKDTGNMFLFPNLYFQMSMGQALSSKDSQSWNSALVSFKHKTLRSSINTSVLSSKKR